MVLSNLALFKCLTQTQACVLTCWILSKPLYIHDIELFKVLDFIDFFFSGDSQNDGDGFGGLYCHLL